LLSREDDTSGKVKKHVNAFYRPNFITLLDEDNLTISPDNSMLTAMIADSFPAKALQQLEKQPLRWICIDFPQTISSRLLQDVVCVMNCFPVINRRLHELTFGFRKSSISFPCRPMIFFSILTKWSVTMKGLKYP